MIIWRGDYLIIVIAKFGLYLQNDKKPLKRLWEIIRSNLLIVQLPKLFKQSQFFRIN